MQKFKAENAFVKRRSESARMRSKFPDRVPVILDAHPNSHVPPIDKSKFLVPSDLTVGQFAYVIRRRISLSPTQAMFMYVRNVLPVSSLSFGELDAEHRDEDGFLYVTYSGENTFGKGAHHVPEALEALRAPRRPLRRLCGH